jgi:hypothetical protein
MSASFHLQLIALRKLDRYCLTPQLRHRASIRRRLIWQLRFGRKEYSHRRPSPCRSLVRAHYFYQARHGSCVDTGANAGTHHPCESLDRVEQHNHCFETFLLWTRCETQIHGKTALLAQRSWTTTN